MFKMLSSNQISAWSNSELRGDSGDYEEEAWALRTLRNTIGDRVMTTDDEAKRIQEIMEQRQGHLKNEYLKRQAADWKISFQREREKRSTSLRTVNSCFLHHDVNISDRAAWGRRSSSLQSLQRNLYPRLKLGPFTCMLTTFCIANKPCQLGHHFRRVKSIVSL